MNHALSVHQDPPATKEALARKDPADQKVLSVKMEKMETKVTPDFKDQSDFKDQLDHQDQPDQLELQDVSTKSMDLLDLKELQVQKDLKGRKEFPELMEPTPEAVQDHKETTVHPDLQEPQDLKELLVHKDLMVKRDLANIVHHHVLHQAIKSILLLQFIFNIKISLKTPRRN